MRDAVAMDQNMMIIIGVMIALSMVTVAMVILKVPRQIFVIWAVAEGIIIAGLVLMLVFMKPA